MLDSDITTVKSTATPIQHELENNHQALPISWYPVCKSSELKKRKIKLLELFDGQWIIYRTQSGKPVVQSRYCCHMGVDLLCGKINGERLICPMHDWEFNSEGVCVKTPSDDPIPRAAKQNTLTCVERYGIVFVHWGDDILFDIPSFPGLVEPMLDNAYCRVAPTPFLSIMLNAFDVHHMKYVHGREVTDTPVLNNLHGCHMGIDLTTRVLLKHWNDYLTRLLGFSTAHIRFDCWSGNMIMVSNYSAKFRVLLALAPVDSDRCKVFFVGAMEQHRLSRIARIFKRVQLYLTGVLGREFLKLDIPIFTGMRPKPGVLLKEADAFAIIFWQHWKRLPRQVVASDGKSAA